MISKNSKYFKLFGYLSLVFIVLLNFNCTKLNVEKETKYTSETTSKFFSLPVATNPLVRRVAAAMELQNSKVPFIDNFVLNEGYAIWDKVMLKESKRDIAVQSILGNTTSAGVASTDSAVVIPLALENTNKINSYLIAYFTDSLTIKLCRSRNYANYSFENANNGDSLVAEKIALMTMALDKLVFGYSEFDITDSRLFAKLKAPNTTQTQVTRKINLTSIDGGSANVLQFFTTTICFTYSYEENYPNPNSVNCPPGQACQWTHTVYTNSCSSFTSVGDEDYYGTSGGGTSGGGPPGGGGGPTGGGGGPIGNGNPTGGGPTGGSGLGWTPVVSADPCDDFIMSLQNNQNFVNKFHNLNRGGQNAPTIQDFEQGYQVTNIATNVYDSVHGISGTPFIRWTITQPISGVLHCHFDGGNSIFSPEDVVFMAQIFLSNYYVSDTANFFFGVTSYNNPPYLIKVGNIAKYRIFAQKIAGTPEDADIFIDKYKNKVVNTNGSGNNEIGFLKMIKDNLGEDGLILYSGNEACDTWTKLKLNFNGNFVSTIPCL